MWGRVVSGWVLWVRGVRGGLLGGWLLLFGLVGLVVVPGFAGASVCVNSVFRGGVSAHLPDCRAYEEVTPVVKSGAAAFPFAVASDGSGVVYSAEAAFAGTLSGGLIRVQYRASRGSLGWGSVGLLPTATVFTGNAVSDVSPDLGRSFVVGGKRGVGSDPPGNGISVFQPPSAGLPGGVVAAVTPVGRPAPAGTIIPGVSQVIYRGGSSDLSHLLFSQTRVSQVPPLVAGDPTLGVVYSSYSLVEDFGVGSGSPEYRLVGVDNGGVLISSCSTGTGSSVSNYHSMSVFGGTIFFGPALGAGCSDPVFGSSSPVFARIGGAVTVDTSLAPLTPVAPVGLCSGACLVAPRSGATFEGASADGSKVFFSTSDQLLNFDVDNGNDLYECILPADTPTGVEAPAAVGRVNRCPDLLPVSVSGSSGSPADVVGVVRISNDGSHVYFVARGVLASGVNGEGVSAGLGANNFYVFERDSRYPDGHVAFITRLPDSDSSLWGIDQSRPVQSTPDGRFLVFDSSGQLTADDSDSAVDVYEYDALNGVLVRVSHGQNGFDADGNNSAFDATIGAPNWAGGNSQGAFAAVDQLVARAVSDDGAFVFFSTSEALQADDTNGSSDVYEWHDGVVSLISSGRVPGDSNPDVVYGFMGASSSGRDVFFASADVLVPEGADGFGDIYDARVDGGFPAPSARPSCSGDVCQGPSSSGPVLPGVGGSAVFTGGINLTPAAPKVTAVKKPKKKTRTKTKKKKAKKARARVGSRVRVRSGSGRGVVGVVRVGFGLGR